MNLENKIFELIDNEDGLAATKTRMLFGEGCSPCKATYSGDNIVFGHAIITLLNSEISMLYHALTTDGELVAGKALVNLSKGKFGELNMKLTWQWLTGGLSSGVSSWREVVA